MIPFFFFFNDTATTEIYTLSLHDALPILYLPAENRVLALDASTGKEVWKFEVQPTQGNALSKRGVTQDRKSTRLNSSHDQISYAVFCLKKKKKKNKHKPV